jgi:L-asparagine oxygenase
MLETSQQENPDYPEITLNPDEASSIKNGLSSISYDPYGGDSYISAIRTAAYRCIPQRILDILEKQKSIKYLSPYFILNNLPIDTNINGSPSFTETGHMFKSGCLSENIICAIGAIIGEPYSIYFEGRELVNNLTPQKSSKYDYTGLGSEVELDLHIENSALRYISQDDCSPRGMKQGVRRLPSTANY